MHYNMPVEEQLANVLRAKEHVVPASLPGAALPSLDAKVSVLACPGDSVHGSGGGGERAYRNVSIYPDKDKFITAGVNGGRLGT